MAISDKVKAMIMFAENLDKNEKQEVALLLIFETLSPKEQNRIMEHMKYKLQGKQKELQGETWWLKLKYHQAQ